MSIKQGLFIGGIVLQLSVLAVTLHNLHDNNKRDVYAMEDLSDEEESFEKDSFYHLSERGGIDLPFKHYVVGRGVVRPSSDYIVVDTALSGVIDKVLVKPGDVVQEGQLLFKIDDSNYKYTLRQKKAECEVAMAKLDFMKERPSKFELQAKEMEVAQAKTVYEQTARDHAIFESLLIQNAISKNEKEEVETKFKISESQLEKILCEYEQMKSGPSLAKVRISELELKEKEATASLTEKFMQDCNVRAPIAGRVLKVNVNAGQYVDPLEKEAVVIGSEDPLHLHVFVEEKDFWRISPTKNLKAIAVHKSNPKMHFVLNFESVRPCLQGEGELEVVFSFDRGKSPIYLEQTLDVYIDSASPKDTDLLDYQFNRAINRNEK